MDVRLFEVLLVIACALVLVPALTLFVEVIAAATATNLPRPREAIRRQRIAVLIPAHNEELTIASTLQSIGPQLGPRDRVLVVADNCSDATERTAREQGAEVVARSDRHRLGKGYALDFGIRHLESDAPDIVIVVDADCHLAPHSLDRLAATAAATGRPVQALYTMRAAGEARLAMRISEFAWVLKNRARPLGLLRMGLPCQLMGTGMGFPWPSIKAASLATGDIVEDLKLGLELTCRGNPPLFCPEAMVSSVFPASREGLRSQRTRWEHGHLRTIVHGAPRLFLRSIIRRDATLAAMALDLSVPPLSLLALATTTTWAAAAALAFATSAKLPLAVATAAALLLGAAIVLSWWRFGRQVISFSDLMVAAVYGLCKVPLYLKFLVRPQSKWVRSRRGDEP
jgi:cellulose synthase/poly-beta-1,6-N-acetylglucosamine synthase-like glycosyltransferase